MDKIEIVHPAGNWQAEYKMSKCGGPLALSIDGQLVVSDFDNAFDGCGNNGLEVLKSHVYHKSGVAVFEGEGRYASGPETSVWTACRHAANLVRVTTDFTIKKDTAIKESIQCGSMTLHGSWKSVLLVPEFKRTTLSAGQTLEFAQVPLAWVFEREDGFKLEIDTGFDVWRWQKGLELGETKVEVAVFADHVDFKRYLLKVAGEEAVLPPSRDYRFCSQLAWSMPSLESKIEFPELTKLELLPKGKGVNVNALPDCPAVSVDFRELEALESMHVVRDGKTEPALCWECNNTKVSAKKIFRQLRAKSSEGHLLIEGGMTPSYCENGKHVDRPGKTVPHWDLNGVTAFAIWARQCLGAGWRVQVKQPAPWNELPSLQCLFAPNGFESSEESKGE